MVSRDVKAHQDTQGSEDDKRYVSLSPDCIIRMLETPHIYHLEKDELYEIDQEAFEFLIRCDGSQQLKQLNPDPDFFRFCLEEDLLQLRPERHINPLADEPIPLLSPSLRYLEVQITSRCNLKCRHCLLPSVSPQDLSVSDVRQVVTEFNHLQGLKVIVSGGEPLMHPEIDEILDTLKGLKLRKVLLTNGTLITPRTIPGLQGIQEIQISLDGLRKGHEHLRGEGTFDKTVEAIRLCRQNGFKVSAATMLHRQNLDEIEQLSGFLRDLGVQGWGIDVPFDMKTGDRDRFFGLSPEEAASYLRFAFGGSFHGGTEGFGCGRHLCTVLPDGRVCKCDFYAENPVGHISEGLGRCWARLTHTPLSRLECRECSHVEECGGGCRKRAGSELGADPVMCAFYHQKLPASQEKD
jgi:radical SAM protein with 4Fe4S-binding SPASM domain